MLTPNLDGAPSARVAFTLHRSSSYGSGTLAPEAASLQDKLCITNHAPEPPTNGALSPRGLREPSIRESI
ncbi:hypothetical protein CYMTET_4830 [Cymbomonas tetramitiformis]|uniref:Uncharacterized protein n=1 Tax=Cymbomonas tetramitiformis TaxID=36881 RepID=A0AAE0H0K6_9CHLO|nr:hypothetical protein CYMTET_4830 [Cymbomonas tetramitiformis]